MSVPNHKKSSNGHAPKVIKAPKRRAAFYDLDGTLVDLNLVHAAIFTLANVGEWSGRVSYLLGFAARIPRLYVAEQRDRRLLNTRPVRGVQGRLARPAVLARRRILRAHS